MRNQKQTNVWGTPFRLVLSSVGLLVLSIIVIIFSTVDTVQAQSSDLNSAVARYPNIANTALQSCDLCHTGNIPNLNPYGADYLNNGRSSAAFGLIENIDSDGDGFTNIQEIRDHLTFPGDPNSLPSVTATPTDTSVPPTPTLTSVPPTPTSTGPVTDTPTTPPTDTSIPPTATPGTPAPGGLDLDIKKFKVSSEIELKEEEAKSIKIRVDIKNSGMVDGQGVVTVVGVQNGVEVYRESMNVSDPVGGGHSRFMFPSYTPSAGGEIVWTASLTDDDPDMDVQVETTRVKDDHDDDEDEDEDEDENGNSNDNGNDNSNGNGNDNSNGNGNDNGNDNSNDNDGDD